MSKHFLLKFKPANFPDMKTFLFQTILTNELNRLKESNPKYSLRAFAKKLGISPALLSQLINGNRFLTYPIALKIFNVLSLDKEVEDAVLKEINRPKQKSQNSKNKRTEISEEQLDVIGTWEYFATLSLADIKHNSCDPRWLSERLNISVEKATLILSKLLDTELIVIENGSFTLNKGHIETTDGISSKAIRQYHKSAISKAFSTIDEIPPDERLLSALTIPVNTEDIQKVYTAANTFKNKVSKITGANSDFDRVYQLSVQFIPLDRRTS